MIGPAEAVDALSTGAVEEPTEVDGLPWPPLQSVGTEIGVATTAAIGVVVITVRVRPGKAE